MMCEVIVTDPSSGNFSTSSAMVIDGGDIEAAAPGSRSNASIAVMNHSSNGECASAMVGYLAT